MRSSLRGGDGKLRALSGHGLAQSHDQVSRQEGAVSGSAEDPLRVGPVGRGPVEPGEDSGERSGMLLHPIGNDRQALGRRKLDLELYSDYDRSWRTNGSVKSTESDR